MCVFPKLIVRFGILHYMAVTLLILSFMSFLTDYIPFVVGISMLLIYILIMKNTPSDNFFLNILGFDIEYNTMDYFPIFQCYS